MVSGLCAATELSKALLFVRRGLAEELTRPFRHLSRGNVKALQHVCEKARQDAFLMMMQDAVRYPANGIVGFRYDTTEMGDGLTEVLAYGTAVFTEAS